MYKINKNNKSTLNTQSYLNDYLYGMYCNFFFSFTLRLQFKSIANSLNNSFHLIQFISP